MAHWTDGPEYAPTERPDVFVEPEATPLPDPVPPPSPDAGVPIGDGRPTYDALDGPALDALAAPEPVGRDPKEAFDVASTPMTPSSGPATVAPPVDAPPPTGAPVDLPPPDAVAPAPGTVPLRTNAHPEVQPPGAPQPGAMVPGSSAWGAAHAHQAPRTQGAWAPDQPFPAPPPPPPSHLPGPPSAWPPPSVNPGGFDQGPPLPWQQPVDQRGGLRPVSVSDMAREATPGVLIPLGIGAILSPVAIPLLLVASVLATRIRYRRPVVARAFNLLIGLTMTLGLVTSFGERGSFDLFAWYDASAGWAQLACLTLFVAVPLIVGEGLRRGERPTSPWDGDDPGRR